MSEFKQDPFAARAKLQTAGGEALIYRLDSIEKKNIAEEHPELAAKIAKFMKAAHKPSEYFSLP